VHWSSERQPVTHAPELLQNWVAGQSVFDRQLTHAPPTQKPDAQQVALV
jgi:hypothetical protein